MCDHQESTRALQRQGDVIDGSYTLGALLGIGGMGVVYAAIQRSLGRAVAVKLPRPELASDPAVRERFRSEARAGSRVHHRNVVHVLDFGDVDGAPYLVMEHVVGPRLGDLVSEHGSLPVAFATELVEQVLAGLQAAHENGVVHSDVKCDNILVQTSRDGGAVPRLIDFGIARLIDDPHASCSGGAWLIAGTPEYLAPELIRGEAPTFASDVYATGVLLYELVTGATPFAGGTRSQVLRRQLDDEPAPMSWRAPHRGVPEALDELVGRALAKRPGERFADAAAFRAALAQVVLSEPSSPRARWRLAAGSAPVSAAGSAAGFAAGSAPGSAPFSTDGATAPMRADVVRRGRAGASPGSDERRQAVGAAIRQGDVDEIVSAYLELSRVLIDEHRMTLAITELEEGLELLSASTEPARRAPLWRLLLSLAALYDGHGERAKARATTCVARELAVVAGSGVGRARAERLWTRLAQGDPAARAPPWYRDP